MKYTGAGWVTGYFVGGLHGAVRFVRQVQVTNYSVQFNAALNGFSKYGTKLSNRLAVIGLLKYSCIQSLENFKLIPFAALLHTSCIDLMDELELENVSGEPALTPICAGLLLGVGMRFKRGPRAAAVYGVLGATLSLAYWTATSHFSEKFSAIGGGRKL